MDNDRIVNIEWGLSTLDKYSKIVIDKRLDHLKLTKIQLLFIIHLKFSDGIRQDHLIKVFNMNRPTVSRYINNMIKLGYIDKRQDEYKRSTNFIFLTSRGHEIYQEVYSVLNQWLQELTQGFTEQEVEMCTRLLLRMAANACQAQGDKFLHQQLIDRIQYLTEE